MPTGPLRDADAMPIPLRRSTSPSALATPSLQDQLRQLYETHHRAVRQFLVRLGGPGTDSEDLAHEVFLIAWNKLGQFGGELPGRAWLMAIALKVAAGARRRTRIRRFLGLDRIAELPARGTPATEFEKTEASRTVYAALDALSEKKRTVFVLYELQGFTGEEIAEMLQCPLKTVWSRLASAREEFERVLGASQPARRDEGGEP